MRRDGKREVDTKNDAPLLYTENGANGDKAPDFAIFRYAVLREPSFSGRFPA